MFKKLTAPQTESEITQYWKFTDQVYITIVCTTFNQEKYISESIDSFLAQVTMYKFEILIQDDVSLDKTSEIINNYKKRFPNIIRVIKPKENLYSKYPCKIWENLVPEIYGKYISLCEGDDYWIDKYKIQKQISVFESGELHNISLVYSDSYRLKQTEQVFYYKQGSVKSEINSESLVLVDGIMTLTTMFKYSDFVLFFEKYHTYIPRWNFADLPMWFHLSSVGNFHFLSDKVSVYRELDESASNSKSKDKIVKFNIDVVDVRLFFADYLNINLSCYLKFVFINKFVFLKSRAVFFRMLFVLIKKILRKLICY